MDFHPSSVDSSGDYIGRFAPTPTGPLHFGSLVTAVASFLQAKSQHGQWLLRIDDIDNQRVDVNAVDAILCTLEKVGLFWDSAVFYQSQQFANYRSALAQLEKMGVTYPCQCSRKDIAAIAQQGSEGPIYPNTCRNKTIANSTARSLRVKTYDKLITFDDAIQGSIRQKLTTECGDFVVYRFNEIYNYQLTVVIDDQTQGITEIVRGSDLLMSTPRQIYMQQLLNIKTPRYMHIPIAVDKQGDKLSKQTAAAPIDPNQPAKAIINALKFLNQQPPLELVNEPLASIWQWALTHWDAKSIPKTRSIAI